METGKSVLVIDDDPDVRKAIRLGAEDMGLLVVEAGNGKEGLARLDDGDFEVIICDVWMPQMDGVTFMKAMAERRPGQRVLAISGGGEAPAALSLKMTEMYGVSDVLYKPFTPDELRGKISSLMA